MSKKWYKTNFGLKYFLWGTKIFASGFLLLLCKNEKGFQNLSKLISISSLKNSANSDVFVTFSDLKKYSEGLICLSGGQFGILTENSRFNNFKVLDKLIKIFEDIYQSDYFLKFKD